MKKLQILLLFLIIPYLLSAQNLRQISNSDDLTSNAVLSIHQSEDGILWMGTCDGINTYYGQGIEQPTFGNDLSLSGYLVENIVQSDINTLWMQTPHGLYKTSLNTQNTRHFAQFDGFYLLRLTSMKEVMVLSRQKELFLYNASIDQFERINLEAKADEEIVNIGSSDDLFWTAGEKGIVRYHWLSSKSKPGYRLETPQTMVSSPIIFCSATANPEILYAIDKQGNLFLVNIRNGERKALFNLYDDIKQRGVVTAIIENNHHFFISFKIDGVIKYQLNEKNHTVEKQDLGIRAGIFQMTKDCHQDLLWIATDGQGVFAYWEEGYNISSFLYKDFSQELGKPIRSLFVDQNKWLWIGTKGEGLLAFDRSNGRTKIHKCPYKRFTANNSTLKDNSVYTLSPSQHNGFWIGTEGGLNFYNYRNRTIETVAHSSNIKYIHSLYESGDSLLWIATVGNGIFKTRIVEKNGRMALQNVKQFQIDNGNFSSNFFFAMYPTTEDTFWLGNRGNGIFQIANDTLRKIEWENSNKSILLNDVYTIIKTDSILWAGTGAGLLGIHDKTENFIVTKEDGLPNNMIHALLPEKDGGLWIATNRGIARMGDKNEIKEVYNYKNGLKIIEFSDGASLKTEDALYFGGVNGWIEIRENPNKEKAKEYIPPVFFTKFKTRNQQVNLHNKYHRGEQELQEYTIHLPHTENSFALGFVALDYINSSDYSFFYKISSSNEEGTWMDNGRYSQLSIPQLAPGEYKISIKCHNNVTGSESTTKVLNVVIASPWYATFIAKIIYMLVLFLLVYAILCQYNKNLKRKSDATIRQLQQQHKEELYEEKLRFFTNITHEFRTPLTLIYSPCERILTHEGSDSFVKKYAALIKKNTERLNFLIQEIIDYRRIETKHQVVYVRHMNVTSVCMEIYASFEVLAEQNNIVLEQDIAEEVFWDSDVKNFSRILGNLMSNAMKYTPEGGTVRLSVCVNDQNKLEIRVFNTGEGIKEEDKKRIFNRYSILDNVEETTKKGLSSRNGLGMAICYSTVELLQGTIDINSEVGSYAEFVVQLPMLPLTEGTEQEKAVTEIPTLELQNLQMNSQMTFLNTTIPAIPAPDTAADTQNSSMKKPHALVIDDNEDILFLLKESLTEYEVDTASNGQEALKTLKVKVPDIIITDIMMPGTDGITLTRQIRQNKYTKHIPLIILSARNGDSEKTEGLLSGADAYIGKPFNIDYLKATMERLLEMRKSMKEYYNTSACAYEFMDGQLFSQEDKAFIQQMREYIDQNLKNEELSIEAMASYLKISQRSLYRKLKELNQPSPKDFIKERKIEHAAKLLITTQMTIQEVMYESGFTNRAYFYKEFGKKYNKTPREYRLSEKQDS